jgi:small subunit ribosomal protein S16
MVVIRLARGGAKKRPFFNIVATDSRNPRDGRFIERVGFYNPVAAEGDVKFRIASDRLGYWSGVGAQMSPTVARLVKQFGAQQGVAPAGAGVAPAGEAAAA